MLDMAEDKSFMEEGPCWEGKHSWIGREWPGAVLVGEVAWKKLASLPMQKKFVGNLDFQRKEGNESKERGMEG
jgi:hypothetical protein